MRPDVVSRQPHTTKPNCGYGVLGKVRSCREMFAGALKQWCDKRVTCEDVGCLQLLYMPPNVMRLLAM
jgi:hypothetical protein